MRMDFSNRLRITAAGFTWIIGMVQTPSVIGQPHTIYQWVDAKGRIYYADKPAPSPSTQPSNAVTLPEINLLQAQEETPQQPKRKKVRSTTKPSALTKTIATADCDLYRQRIRDIEQQLRIGYQEPAGAQLHRRKRNWSELLYDRCY